MLNLRTVCLAALALLASWSIFAADLGYDPKADPFDAYHAAMERAALENKLVLIVAGGDWCTWCHALEKFIARDPEVRARLHDTFVVMKVYVGFDNYNEEFFSQLPPARGAPHFWVVSPGKQVLSSQSTAALEQGRRGYDREAFLSFVERWRRTRMAGQALSAGG